MHGWLESVHPDDRDACMSAVSPRLRAERSASRWTIASGSSTGEYRWLMDIGEPRYGTDGEFHGYVGGGIDITERRDAEQMLRDLNRRLILAQEEERRRIARDLHDHLNQQLALLAIDLQQLALHPPDAARGAGRRAAGGVAADLRHRQRRARHLAPPASVEARSARPASATIAAHCRDVSRQIAHGALLAKRATPPASRRTSPCACSASSKRR